MERFLFKVGAMVVPQNIFCLRAVMTSEKGRTSNTTNNFENDCRRSFMDSSQSTLLSLDLTAQLVGKITCAKGSKGPAFDVCGL